MTPLLWAIVALAAFNAVIVLACWRARRRPVRPITRRELEDIREDWQ